MTAAFLLGAGLGTRLRPLTEHLPKPLVPVVNRPLAAYALDHLASAGIRRCVINTHHCPERWTDFFPTLEHAGVELTFRHEPVLLETGGGLKNIEDWAGDADDILIYNGDALTDLPLEKLLDAHRKSGCAVTMALRSEGGPLQVQCAQGRIEDIRKTLGGSTAPAFLFTGLYVVSARVFSWFEPGLITSVIPVFLDKLREGEELGGVVLDEGRWLDLGTREAYLEAHQWFQNGWIPACRGDRKPITDWNAQDVKIATDAHFEGFVACGEGARIGTGAHLEDCVVWAGAQIAPGSVLRRCIVRENQRISGTWSDHDF